MTSRLPPPPRSQRLVENRVLKCQGIRLIMDPNRAVTEQSSDTELPPCRKPDSLLFDRKWRLRLPTQLEIISELQETWEYKPKKPLYVMPWSLGLPPQCNSDAAVSVVGTARCYNIRERVTPACPKCKEIPDTFCAPLKGHPYRTPS